MAPAPVPPSQGQSNFLGRSSSLIPSNNFYSGHRTASYEVNLMNSKPEESYSLELLLEELLEATFKALNIQNGDEWIVDSRALAHFWGIDPPSIK